MATKFPRCELLRRNLVHHLNISIFENLIEKTTKISILVQDIDNPTYSRLESATESYGILAIRDIPRKSGKQELSYRKVKDYVENSNRFDEDVAGVGRNILTDERNHLRNRLKRTSLRKIFVKTAMPYAFSKND